MSTLSQSLTKTKKTNMSSSLIDAGRAKASSSKSNKKMITKVNDSIKHVDSDITNSSISTDNKNKNNSITSNKAKLSDNNNNSGFETKKKANDNKNIPIFYRPVKRKQPYKPSEVDFHIGVDFESFGKEAPKFTISSSQQSNTRVQTPQPQPLDNPAPGEYNPVLTPNLVSPNPLQHYMSRADSSMHGPIKVETEMSNEDNRNIDYIDSKIYETLRTKGNIKSTIGSVEHAPKFYANEMGTALSVPGCTFIPSREMSFDGPVVKIAHKTPTKYETDNPGPGEYLPDSKSVLSRSPVYQLSGPQFRFDWLEDKRNIPSPNQYNPQRLETSSPQYSIGSKSRINKTNRQKKANISEESTRIALLNAESRDVVTAPSRYRNRGRRGNTNSNEESNYYLPSEENKKNRPKARNASTSHSNASYYNERFNQTSSATRREREKIDQKQLNPTNSNFISPYSYSYSNSSYNYDYNNNNRNDDSTVYSSFYSKCVNVNSNKKNIVPFPVGSFIMKLDVKSIPMNEARKYIAKHQELVAWVEYILDQVMYYKPDAPLLLIREIFLQIKEQDLKQKTQFEDEDEFNINQVLVHLKEKSSGIVY